MVYSLKINDIAERNNDLIITKAYFLLLDSNLSQLFWPKAFDIVVYLLKYISFIKLKHNISLENLLKVYHNDYDYSFSQDLSHLRIWNCKILVYIS